MPDLSQIVQSLSVKQEVQIPVADEVINVKYSRAGSGALSVSGFNTIRAAIDKGDEMGIEEAENALLAFQIEWDLTDNGVAVPPTKEGIQTVPMIITWIVLNGVLSDFFPAVPESANSVSGSKAKKGGEAARAKRRSA